MDALASPLCKQRNRKRRLQTTKHHRWHRSTKFYDNCENIIRVQRAPTVGRYIKKLKITVFSISKQKTYRWPALTALTSVVGAWNMRVRVNISQTPMFLWEPSYPKNAIYTIYGRVTEKKGTSMQTRYFKVLLMCNVVGFVLLYWSIKLLTANDDTSCSTFSNE